VWLHGGGYTSGAGSLEWYDGGPLSTEGDVVVVGVNYRLGPLGFLFAEGLGDGQAGVQDIILALRWVRENISQFGGNPFNVTVAGQSAGAQAIMCMLTMAGVPTLFHRAILQSPPAGVAPFSKAKATGHGERFIEILGYSHASRDERISLLRAEPVGALLGAAGTLGRETATFGGVEPPFFPVIDDLADATCFVDDAARGAAKAGVAVLIGTNRDEARAMGGGMDGQLDRELGRYLFETAGPDGARFYRARTAHRSDGEILAQAMTDDAFLRGCVRFAETMTELGGQVWCYQVDWSPVGSPLGACHCIELPLVFGTLSAWRAAPMLQRADPAELQRLSALVRGSWLQFATSGTPQRDLPWPQYDPGRRSTMLYNTISGVVGDPAGANWRL
jgi:para-nitrobenzyl esterase